MVRPIRFERMTLGLGVPCSIQLSYGRARHCSQPDSLGQAFLTAESAWFDYTLLIHTQNPQFGLICHVCIDLTRLRIHDSSNKMSDHTKARMRRRAFLLTVAERKALKDLMCKRKIEALKARRANARTDKSGFVGVSGLLLLDQGKSAQLVAKFSFSIQHGWWLVAGLPPPRSRLVGSCGVSGARGLSE